MRFRERKQASEDSLPFVKLDDGQSIEGTFTGEPYEFYQHWKDNRSVICPGKDTCEKCKEGDKGSFRFRLNLIVREGQGFTAKVFEQGAKVYEQLRDIDQEYEGLEKVAIKITRKGLQRNTSYSIIPKGVVPEKFMKELAKVPLRELSPRAPQENEAVEETADDLPF